MKETKCEIITVGTELLLGQIVDTNSSWLSENLARVGINVYYKQTVGDNFNRMLSVFKQAQSRSNIVIVTGGLGPTEDDLTRQVAKEHFNCKVEIHQPTLEKIENYFKERQIEMTDNNRKQALSFKGGRVFNNQVGMAPGLFYEYKGVLWFFLPGVPREMKWLVKEEIIPFLNDYGILDYQLSSKVLTFSGIGESILETKLFDLIKEQSNPTIAPLAGNGYVTVRLTAKAKTLEQAQEIIKPVENEILKRLNDFFVGYDDIPLELQLMKLLRENELTISSCESLTGGLFASSIVKHDGASDIFKGAIVSYTNDVKENVVDVPKSVLQSHGAVSEVTAKLMAENVRLKLNSHIGISFTGVAGKTSVEGHKQGTVFIAFSSHDHATVVKKYNFSGNRQEIQEQCVKEGLKMILEQIKK